jgi:hypothetical protein
MRRARLTVVAGLALALIGAAVACSDNGTGGGTAIDLSGTYNLVTLAFNGLPFTGSTGTLVFTSSIFNADLQLVSPDTSIVHDTTIVLGGTYTAKSTGAGDSVYLILPQNLGTIPGTFTVSGAAKDTLGLTLLFSGALLQTTWHKQ